MHSLQPDLPGRQNASTDITAETTGPAPSRISYAPGATPRALIMGAILIPFNCFWVVRMERVMFGPYPSTVALFANVVFILFALVGINSVLRLIAPRIALAQGELLVLYTMLAISTGLAGLDGVATLCQLIPHGAWFGQGEGSATFSSAFPNWLIIRDKEVIRGHYLGHTSFYTWPILRAWLVPALAWTVFVTLLLYVANCINVLVRAQWADRERLTFPITWLPLEMTDGGTGSSFFHNRLMWCGFAVAALLSLWNGVAFLYPSLPSLPLGATDLKPMLLNKPWSAIDWLPITLYPLVIGLGFTLPLDVLFSCWIFFLYWKLQVVVSSSMGWDATPEFPYTRDQGFGAAMGLFGFYVWSGRHAWRTILKQAWNKSTASLSESGMPEALTARGACLGIFFGLTGLFVFGLLAGASLWTIAAFYALYLPMIVVVSRVRAELGAPVHDFHFMGPDSMLPRFLGTGGLRQEDMAFFTFSYAFTRAHRSDTMPVGLEGLQMAKARRFRAGGMFRAIILATVLGTLGTFWAFEHQAYQLGTTARFVQGYGFGMESFQRLHSWQDGSLNPKPNGGSIAAMIFGLLGTLLLCIFRTRFIGFPLHPIGYVLSSSWAIHLIWFPLLIAWMLKGFTLRYGGLRSYRQFLPFFLGLALGDCVFGSLWGLLGLLFKMRTYNFFGA